MLSLLPKNKAKQNEIKKQTNKETESKITEKEASHIAIEHIGRPLIQPFKFLFILDTSVLEQRYDLKRLQPHWNHHVNSSEVLGHIGREQLGPVFGV